MHAAWYCEINRKNIATKFVTCGILLNFKNDFTLKSADVISCARINYYVIGRAPKKIVVIAIDFNFISPSIPCKSAV